MEKMIQLGEKLHWLDIGGKKTPEVVDKAKKFVKENDERDFFLFLNFMDCHLPYEPEEEYRERHAPGVDPSGICQKAHDHNGGRAKANFESSEKLYNAEVDYLDDQLGEFLEFYRNQGLDEKTVFVIVSDHGENLGEDDKFGHQFSVSEQLVSVPLMIRAPGLNDKEVDVQIELREVYDIVPWLAGIEGEPEYGTGIALGGYQYPELDLKNIPERKKEELGKRFLFARGDGKKLIRSGDDQKMIELEKRAEIEIDKEFSDKLDRIGEAESGSTEVEDEEVKQRLEELGYL